MVSKSFLLTVIVEIVNAKYMFDRFPLLCAVGASGNFLVVRHSSLLSVKMLSFNQFYFQTIFFSHKLTHI